jgi:hypothetical protein
MMFVRRTNEVNQMSPREMTVFAFSILAAIPPVAAQGSAPNANTGALAVAPYQEVTVRAIANAGPDADVRACLEFATNLEVIVCAEQYRPHKRNA